MTLRDCIVGQPDVIYTQTREEIYVRYRMREMEKRKCVYKVNMGVTHGRVG